MHGRKLISTGTLTAILSAAAVLGGCRDNASTGPSHVQSKDFAAALRSVQGDQQVGSVGTALAESLQVKVVDANGLPVEGATVTFAVRTGGGSIIPPANVSSSTGFVSAVWILGTTLGANKAVAILTNGFTLDSAVFNATATPGAPALLTKVSGDTQTTRVGHALAAPLIVKLTDQFGFVRSGVHVTWTPGAFSGSLAPFADTTGADGTAQATWTLGTQVSSQSATASVTGTTPVVFTATSTADTNRVIVPVQGNAQTGPVAQALPTVLKIKVTDQYGNPIAGEAITWTDSIGGGSVSSAGGKTAADGTASTTFTLGNHAGAQLVVATHSLSGFTLGFSATATISFSEVFAGNFQVCGITASNQSVYCWGNNDAGQLAKGNTSNTNAPSSAVSTGSDTVKGPFLQVRQMAGGQDQFCALSVARSIYCWGRVMGGAPVQVATRQDLTTGGTNGSQQVLANNIAAGEEHMCVMDLTGLAFCTGVNFHGQLGDGLGPVTPQINTYTFVVPFNFLWSNISAGRSHTCAVPRYNPAPAIGNISQMPRCWGFNSTGQVGNGFLPLGTNYGDVLAPVVIKVNGAVTAFDSLSITTGAQHSCAIAVTPGAASLGQAYCWGDNQFGQLGTGVVISSASRDSVAQPVAQAGILYAKIFAGEFHTCAIATTGDAYCWGRNDYGQLGNGNRLPFNTGTSSPVQVAGGLHFRSLSLGELFTCGVTGALSDPSGAPSSQVGTIYCWGDNVFGQIGNEASATNQPVLAPSKVHFQP
jgi:alpha-tubulin suppressor-like RCC1 family protein